MAKKEIKIEKIEREYTIPLRRKFQHVARYKKTPKAVKSIKEFLVRHMKIRDRNLNSIKIDKHLNEVLWLRGIKKPPYKIKVRVVKEGDIVRVYAIDLPTKLKFKKLREEKLIVSAKQAIEKKKTLMQKAKESIQPGTNKTEEDSEGEKKEAEDKEKKKEDEKEKQKAGEEAGKVLEKAKAKQAKHTTKLKVKQPKRPQRKSLAK